MGRSPDTVRLYVGAVRRWLAAGGAPGHCDEALVVRYLATLRARLAPASVNLAIKALRAFYRLQAELEACSGDEAARLPPLRRPPERIVRFLTVEQFGSVLASLPLATFAGVRDFTLLRVLFETGLRAGEAWRLEVGSILPDGMLYVRGKARRDRYAPIGEDLALALDGYLRARATTRPGKRAALWLTPKGRPLASPRSVWEIVSRRVWGALHRAGGWHAVARAGKPWRGHYPHELRASFATALLRNGCPVTGIAELLGHDCLESTARYLGVDLAPLERAMRCHPRALRLAHSAELPAGDTPTSPEDPAASPERTDPT